MRNCGQTSCNGSDDCSECDPLVAILLAGVASATDYPATWALANHARFQPLPSTASTDAQLPGTMSSGDVNGDGVNDFAYEFLVGTFNVHFGGISADLDLDSFSIVTGNSGNLGHHRRRRQPGRL